MNLHVIPFEALPDIKLITSSVYADHRGTFCEAYREKSPV